MLGGVTKVAVLASTCLKFFHVALLSCRDPAHYGLTGNLAKKSRVRLNLNRFFEKTCLA